MAQTTRVSELVKSVGSFTEIAAGIAGGSGTSTVVTVPQFSLVKAAVVTGDTSTTAMYVGTISTNTFTVTHASGDRFSWIAFGVAKV